MGNKGQGGAVEASIESSNENGRGAMEGKTLNDGLVRITHVCGDGMVETELEGVCEWEATHGGVEVTFSDGRKLDFVTGASGVLSIEDVFDQDSEECGNGCGCAVPCHLIDLDVPIGGQPVDLLADTNPVEGLLDELLGGIGAILSVGVVDGASYEMPDPKHPRLNNWGLFRDGLYGEIYDDPRFNDGKIVVTSSLKEGEIPTPGGVVRTMNTTYTLGDKRG